MVSSICHSGRFETQMISKLEQSPSAWRMRTNVRWNLVGNVVYALGQCLQLVILARMGGPAAVGAYAFALALTGPVMMFASMSLRFMHASDARGMYVFREYLYLRCITTVAAVFVVMIFAGVSGVSHEFWSVLLPVCCMRAADALSDIYYGVWQGHERMSVIAWAMMLNSVSSVAFMTAGVALGGGVPGAAVGSALGSCAALLFVRVRTASDSEVQRAVTSGSGPIAWRRVLRLSVEAAPLGFILLLSSLQQNVPRFFVQRFAGEAALGLFAAASQLTTAAEIVGGALAGAAGPRLARLFANGEIGSFRNLTSKLAAIGLALGAVGVLLSLLAGRWFLVHLYRPEFASGTRMLVVLSAAAGMVLVTSFLGYALTSARVITVQPVLLMITLTVLVMCCVLVVPRYGGDGAAWALVAASSAYALVSWLALHRFAWKQSKSLGLHGPPEAGRIGLCGVEPTRSKVKGVTA
jgi:O-antigen/teichoic acid export membrane protein